jgi:hypothetical protein
MEEELIAMLRPGAKRPARASQRQATESSELRKDEARARILGKLIDRGRSVEGSWEEIKAELGLDDMSMTLFKGSCWHLRVGDRDSDETPRIRVVYSMDREELGYWERSPLIISVR